MEPEGHLKDVLWIPHTHVHPLPPSPHNTNKSNPFGRSEHGGSLWWSLAEVQILYLVIRLRPLFHPVGQGPFKYRLWLSGSSANAYLRQSRCSLVICFSVCSSAVGVQGKDNRLLSSPSHGVRSRCAWWLLYGSAWSNDDNPLIFSNVVAAVPPAFSREEHRLAYPLACLLVTASGFYIWMTLATDWASDLAWANQKATLVLHPWPSFSPVGVAIAVPWNSRTNRRQGLPKERKWWHHLNCLYRETCLESSYTWNEKHPHVHNSCDFFPSFSYLQLTFPNAKIGKKNGKWKSVFRLNSPVNKLTHNHYLFVPSITIYLCIYLSLSFCLSSTCQPVCLPIYLSICSISFCYHSTPVVLSLNTLN
jgi:hypothetical protein